jgi:hypothetical protein
MDALDWVVIALVSVSGVGLLALWIHDARLDPCAPRKRSKTGTRIVTPDESARIQSLKKDSGGPE